MKQFTINKNSTLPYLEIEPINDGRNDFKKLYLAIQNATVTFSMVDTNSGIKKIANEKCYIVPDNGNDMSCDERFKIQYRWRERDTKEVGQYKGQFKIKFNEDIQMENMVFPKGELIVPIAEDIIINIK